MCCPIYFESTTYGRPNFSKSRIGAYGCKQNSRKSRADHAAGKPEPSMHRYAAAFCKVIYRSDHSATASHASVGSGPFKPSCDQLQRPIGKGLRALDSTWVVSCMVVPLQSGCTGLASLQGWTAAASPRQIQRLYQFMYIRPCAGCGKAA